MFVGLIAITMTFTFRNKTGAVSNEQDTLVVDSIVGNIDSVLWTA